MISQIRVKAEHANPDNTSAFGTFIGENVSAERLPIPFYDHVDEGINLPFDYVGRALLRTARIHPTSAPCVWLERHLRMNQFFIGLGSSPFALLLGEPTHEDLSHTDIPNFDKVKGFVFSPGTGLVMHKGTWHDFPVALQEPVTCLTGNSDEVVSALISMESPGEMNQGDVYKISLHKRANLEIFIDV